MRISYSSLSSYRTCPLQYKYKEIDHLREPKSKESVFGTIIHSTLKFAYEPALIPPTYEDTLNYFAQAWNDAIYDDPAEERAAFSLGVDILRRYYEKNNPKDAVIVALENRFQINITAPDGTQHIISGGIDRIDKTPDGYEIIDYKTTKKMPSQKDVDDHLQLSVYTKAFLDRYPKEISNLKNITVSLYFLKHGVKLSSTRTMEDLKRIDELFFETIADIEKGYFEPRVSALCDWCGFQKICPMWRHKFQDRTPATYEEKEKVLGEYLETKREIDLAKLRLMKLQKTILEYMDAEHVDRLFGNSGIIERARTQKFDYDRERLRTTLESVGKWEQILTINQTLLKKTISTLPIEVRKEIESLKIPGKETLTLRVKKTVAEEDLD